MDNLSWYNFDEDFDEKFEIDNVISLDQIINNISLESEMIVEEEIPELLKIQLQNPRFRKMYDERQQIKNLEKEQLDKIKLHSKYITAIIKFLQDQTDEVLLSIENMTLEQEILKTLLHIKNNYREICKDGYKRYLLYKIDNCEELNLTELYNSILIKLYDKISVTANLNSAKIRDYLKCIFSDFDISENLPPIGMDIEIEIVNDFNINNETLELIINNFKMEGKTPTYIKNYLSVELSVPDNIINTLL